MVCAFTQTTVYAVRTLLYLHMTSCEQCFTRSTSVQRCTCTAPTCSVVEVDNAAHFLRLSGQYCIDTSTRTHFCTCTLLCQGLHSTACLYTILHTQATSLRVWQCWQWDVFAMHAVLYCILWAIHTHASVLFPPVAHFLTSGPHAGMLRASRGGAGQ